MTVLIIIIGILIGVNISRTRYNRRNHYYSDSEYSHYPRPPFHNPFYTDRIEPFGQERFRPSEKQREQQALFYTAIFIFLLVVFLLSTR
jgi:hypothetical protein